MTSPDAPPADDSTGTGAWPWLPALRRLAGGWRTVALAAAVAAATAALLWWRFDDRRWEAETVLALGRPEAALTLDERFAEPSVDPTFPYRVGSVRAYPELARMEAVAAEARRALGGDVPAAWTAADGGRRGGVRAAADGTLLVVAARAPDAGSAAALADAFAAAFVRLTAPVFDPDAHGDALERAQAARDAAGWALEAADAAVAGFRSTSDLAALEVDAEALAQRYRDLLAERDRLDAARRAVRAVIAEGGGAPDGAFAAVVRLGALGGLGGDAAPRLELPAAALAEGSDPAVLEVELARALEAVEVAAAGMPQQMRETDARLARERGALARFERQRAVAEDRFLALARRAAELEAERETALPELRVVFPAAVPEAPSFGGLWRSVLAAAFLGALAAAAVVALPPRGRPR